jgi:DNA repair photolyase
MDVYKNPITVRGGHLTCPLPLALESYWTCEADCLHCVGRRLNKTWGNEQRAANPECVKNLLKNALLNKNPQSIKAQALHSKKVLFLGRKADPYQSIEIEKKVTQRLVQVLLELDWPMVICSRYQSNMGRDTDLFLKKRKLIHILVEITPGAESDWEVFEHKKPSQIEHRLQIAKTWQDLGIKVGVRGEPFIPGYHTIKQFRDILKRLRSYGLMSYNIYNLHMNEYTIKRFYNIGLDIEKIWRCNQDAHWKLVQKKLCQIADEEGIELGCPDFVNVPVNWMSGVNTCCGIDVQDAFTYNTHNWRKLILQRETGQEVLRRSWEGIGTTEDKTQAEVIVFGKYSKEFYTMRNAGIL